MIANAPNPNCCSDPRCLCNACCAKARQQRLHNAAMTRNAAVMQFGVDGALLTNVPLTPPPPLAMTHHAGRTNADDSESVAENKRGTVAPLACRRIQLTGVNRH